MSRLLLLVAAVLCLWSAVGLASEPAAHASVAGTSRWWRLDCGRAPACTFTVALRGRIEGSRLFLIERASERRAAVARALGRPVALRVDVDSAGGEVFAALEIGRALRAEGASIAVAPDASCLSACVFVLMGARERRIAPGARVGIHRPSVDADRPALAAALSGALALYADEMDVPRGIVDAMMSVPPDRMRELGPAALARYGLVTDPR